MRLTVNIEKRYVYLIIGLLVLGIGILAVNAAIDANKGWHSLKQIAKSDSDSTSVDEDGDGIIDYAEYVYGGGSIPSGFCIFSPSADSCPDGWTRDVSFDGRTIRGAAVPGGTGGADTHTHSASGLSTGTSNKNSAADNTGWSNIPVASPSHTHTISGSTAAASSWPPYVDVIVCCKE